MFLNPSLPEMTRSIQLRQVLESRMTWKVLRLSTAGQADKYLKTGYANRYIFQMHPSIGLRAVYAKPETLSYTETYIIL